MTWRERMQPASFRGVDFFVDGTTGKKGRRVPVHKLAGKDGSTQQDLGRDPDEFSVETFLWGDDFDKQRDELEKALTTAGPGPLVLPTRGELWVRVTSGPTTSETRGARGYCKITFAVVVEDREAGGLRSKVDTAGALKAAASKLKIAAASDLSSALSVAGMPGKYLRKATNAISSVTTAMRGVQRIISGNLNAVEDLSASIDNLSETASTLLATPSNLASHLVGLTDSIVGLADTTSSTIDRLTGLTNLADDPYGRSASARTTRSASRSLQSLGASEPSPTTQSTPLGKQAATNARAIFRCVRSAAVARSAETYATAPFDSSTLALAALEDLANEASALQAYDAGDDLFASLSDLRAAAADHLARTATNLPEARLYTPPEENPALLLAHELYGDARRESDIVARNADTVDHPGFVREPIEVVGI